MRYYYIHGFNSGENSSTVERLRCALNEDVVCLSYDSSKSFEENYASLIGQVGGDEDFCVVGTSLGSFYANLVASFYGVSCVMFNPVVDAVEELSQFVGENVNYATGNKYMFTEDVLQSYKNAPDNVVSIPRMIFVSSEDEVLQNNVSKVYNKFSHYAEIYVIDGAHRICDFTPFVTQIKETANCFCV